MSVGDNSSNDQEQNCSVSKQYNEICVKEKNKKCKNEKEKQILSKILFTCAENLCGKTYSTVKIHIYLKINITDA